MPARTPQTIDKSPGLGQDTRNQRAREALLAIIARELEVAGTYGVCRIELPVQNGQWQVGKVTLEKNLKPSPAG